MKKQLLCLILCENIWRMIDWEWIQTTRHTSPHSISGTRRAYFARRDCWKSGAVVDELQSWEQVCISPDLNLLKHTYTRPCSCLFIFNVPTRKTLWRRHVVFQSTRSVHFTHTPERHMFHSHGLEGNKNTLLYTNCLYPPTGSKFQPRQLCNMQIETRNWTFNEFV